MAFDFIDMIVNTGDEYLTGVFYKRRPISNEDGGVSFKYKQLDPNARIFDKLLGELWKDRATYAIKTNDDCAFNIGGYIQTQNGLLWEITEVISNEEVKGGNEALRWFKTAKNAEISVRMIQVDDLYKLEETYNSQCKITLSTKDSSLWFIGAEITYLEDYSTENLGADKAYEISVRKGTGVKIELILSNNEKREIVISGNKTYKDELTYKV